MNRRYPRYPDDADYQTNAPSYYEALARKQKLIQLLAEKIWEYDERLDERLDDLENVLQDYLSQWDERIENLDDEVSHIFVTWLNDGTLEQIINHDVLGNKADKETVLNDMNAITVNVNQFSGTDLEKIQSAIDYASLNNLRHVKIPSGVYHIDGGIYLKENISLQGDGDSTILKMVEDGRTPIRMFEGNSTVSNLKLDGDVKNRLVSGDLTRPCAGIHIRNSRDNIVENITLVNFGYKLATELNGENHDTVNNNGQAITIEISKDHDLTTDVRNNIIKNNRIYDNEGRLSFAVRIHSSWMDDEGFPVELGYYDDFYNSFNTIENNYVEGTCKNAFEIVGINSFSNKVLNNKLVNARGYGGFEADFGASHNIFDGNVIMGYNPIAEILIKGNSFDCFRCAGYRNTIKDVPTVGNIFNDNKIMNINVSTGRNFNGIISYSAENTKFTNNTMYNVIGSNDTNVRLVALEGQKNMLIDGCQTDSGHFGVSFSTHPSQDVVISNNHFSNVNYGIRTFVTEGFNKNIQIKNNTFDNCKGGIYLTNDILSSIDDNFFKDWDANEGLRPISFGNNAEGISVINNKMTLTTLPEIKSNTFALTGTRKNSIITNNITHNCRIATGDRRGVNIDNFMFGDLEQSDYTSNRTNMARPDTPARGDWEHGDVIYNSNPTKGSFIGWVYIALNVNDWKGFGKIAE